jgi:hypothetical protein
MERLGNQTDHILIDTTWHWSRLNVSSFRGADYDIDHYLVVAKVRDRLAETKQATQKFSIRKLSEADDKEQYQVKTSRRFAAL